MLNNEIEVSRERGRRQVRSASLRGSNHAGEWQRIARVSVVTALLLGGLAGCGGSDDGDSSSGSTPPTTTPPASQLSAVDGFSVVRPGVATRVDLSTYVRGTGATLASISSNQAQCSATNVSGLAVDITSESGLCEFSYKVSGQGSDASATLNTLASTLASPVLPPLSQTMTLAEPNKAFDLQVLLGADWPAGYSLDPASVLVQGGSAQGTATAAGNVVTYTPPSPTEPVWNQILYVLKDPNRPGEDAMGSLFVTVSDSANKPPVIGVPKYDYNAQGGAPIVTMQTVTLDLSTLPNLNITEPDADEWQLVEVQSYSASVAPVDPNSVTNKQFTFQAGTPGEHIVSYIVGDHEAGFAMGLISIKVGADEKPKTWDNITIGEKTFQATPLYSEVINRGVMAEAVFDAGVNNTVGGVAISAAFAYCSNGNHLATRGELDTLFNTPEVATERLKYPVERTYITYGDGGNARTFDLATGASGNYDPATSPNQYVICVSEATMSYTADTSATYGINTGLSDGGWWVLGTVKSDGGVQGNPVVIASTNIGSTPLSDANVRLTPAGCPLGACKLEVQGDPTAYGNMTVQIANAINTTKTLSVGPLKLMQNAKVAAARTGTNNGVADGTAVNTVMVSVTDKDDLPAASTEVKLKYAVSPTGTVTITPGSCDDAVNCARVTTDGAGEATLSLTATVAGDYTINLPTDALVGGLPTLTGWQDCDGPGVPGTGLSAPGMCFRQPDYPHVLRAWSDADSYCNGLGNGYRMPSRDELVVLYNAYPSGQINNAWGWPLNVSYWSSTQFNATYHYGVVLSSGASGGYLDSTTLYVACVRPN